MIALTPTQERFILKQLENYKPFSNGASRACFDCPIEIVNGLGLDTKYQYVIKLAMGLGGLSQNQLEILTYQQHGEEYPLAEIFAAGRYIEIMEKLEVEYDFRDFVEEGCFFSEEDDMGEEYWGFDEESAAQVEVAAGLLCDLFGHTSDNGQMGYSNISDRYVSYDYGYTTEKYTSEQVSNLTDYIYNEDDLGNYLRELSNILEQEDELLGSIEETILRKHGSYEEDEEEAESEDGADDTGTDYTDHCSSSATWKYGDNKYDTDYDTCDDTEEN